MMAAQSDFSGLRVPTVFTLCKPGERLRTTIMGNDSWESPSLSVIVAVIVNRFPGFRLLTTLLTVPSPVNHVLSNKCSGKDPLSLNLEP